MPRPPRGAPGSPRAGADPATSGVDAVLFVVLAIAVGALVAVWAGAALAAQFSPGAHFEAGLSTAAEALKALPSHGSDPAAAWPAGPRGALPGPVLYRACQGLVVAGLLALAWLAWRVFGGHSEQDGLGVQRSAYFARRADLRRVLLVVRQPECPAATVGCEHLRPAGQCSNQVDRAGAGPRSVHIGRRRLVASGVRSPAPEAGAVLGREMGPARWHRPVFLR